MDFLMSEFQGNLVWQWLVAFGVLLFVGFVGRILLRFAVRKLRAVVVVTPGRFDDLVVDLLEKTRFLFLFVVSLYAGTLFLSLPEVANDVLRTIFVIAMLIQAGTWGNAFVAFWIHRSVRRKLDDDAAAATSLAALGFVAKLVLWTVVVLLTLDNLGVNVSTLIATLGVGGIAIALAVQNILSDLFASLSIIVDRPFVIGDFIIVGEQMGNVEKIGLKTTRVRSLTGEQIIFSNSDLLSSRVRNYRRMYERRIAFTVGVTYQTTPEELEAIPVLIEGIVSCQPDVRFDRCHFKSLGDFALQIETVYYVLVSDYAVYMNVQQAINLGIMRAFAQRGIEFAYPTQTLFVQGNASNDVVS